MYKKPIDAKIFDREFRKWLIEKGFLIQTSYSMNQVGEIVRKFYKENSDNQFAGMRKDTEMWVLREKLLEAKIKELQNENN